jgi:hypothetical protein
MIPLNQAYNQNVYGIGFSGSSSSSSSSSNQPSIPMIKQDEGEEGGFNFDAFLAGGGDEDQQ